MNNSTHASLDQVSALADGQLQGDELRQALQSLENNAELRAQWHVYHLVGEVLRTGQHTPCSESEAFVSRLSQRLAQEPTIARLPESSPAVAPVRVQPSLMRGQAANEPVFRWRMVAGFASVAVAAVIGWSWVGSGGDAAPVGMQMAGQAPGQGGLPQGVAGATLASATGVSVARPPVASWVQAPVQVGRGAPQIMLRDPRLDELLEAHQQASGASQMPSSFLRNATFEGAAR